MPSEIQIAFNKQSQDFGPDSMPIDMAGVGNVTIKVVEDAE